MPAQRALELARGRLAGAGMLKPLLGLVARRQATLSLPMAWGGSFSFQEEQVDRSDPAIVSKRYTGKRQTTERFNALNADGTQVSVFL